MGRPRYTEQGKPKTLYNEGLTVGCTKTQVGKTEHLIITDAMTQNGPVDGGLLIFKAETKKKKRKIGDLSSKNAKQKNIIAAIQRMKPKKRDFYLRKITTTR